MPVMGSKLPNISLLNNLSPALIGSDGYPKERQVRRSILLNVAPDREELLSNSSIEDIRERLKIRVDSPHGHWLYCTNRRHDIKPTRGDSTTRYSLFNRSHNKENATVDHRAAKRDRALSAASSANSGTGASDRGQKRISDVNIDIWSSLSLSTREKLISPRPLGPTHMLVVCERNRDRNTESKSALSEDTLEIPINDLLFLLNVPNIRPNGQNGQFAPILPRRLHQEMPRVALGVPALETFPEVVVYLHTKDRDALFSKLVPEWIRTIVQPLKSTSTSGAPTLKPLANATARICNQDVELSGSHCLSFFGSGFGYGFNVARKASVKRLLKPISPILKLGRTTSTQPHNLNNVITVAFAVNDVPKNQKDQQCKPFIMSAKAVAEAFSSLDFGAEKTDIDPLNVDNSGLNMSSASDHGFENNVLKLTVTKLNALAANFAYLGYFERELWRELDMYRNVIAEALTLTTTLKTGHQLNDR